MSGGFRFTLRTRTGVVLKDVRVQGRGGEIGASFIQQDARGCESGKKTLEAIVRVLGRGRGEHIAYQPKPGHLLCFLGDYKPTRDEEIAVVIPADGLQVLGVKPGNYAETMERAES